MKTLLKTVTATVAGVLAASMVQANSVNALLGSGNEISLQSSSMAVSGGWDYFYTLRNNTDSTVGIDAFTVSGLSDTNGIVVAATAGWGSSLNGAPFANVSWSTGGPIVDLTSSPLTFYFFSPEPPELGSAFAQDGTTYPDQGSYNVVVPNIPDGGVTVSLFGGALLALAGLRRKLGC